jgi:hypothetical protein
MLATHSHLTRISSLVSFGAKIFFNNFCKNFVEISVPAVFETDADTLLSTATDEMQV